MRNVEKAGSQCKLIGNEEVARVGDLDWSDFDTRIAVIRALIPLGLGAVEEELQKDVAQLVGARYARGGPERDLVRWGKQPGSIYLTDRKIRMEVPRVRNRRTHQEVPLPTYRRLREPSSSDPALVNQIVHGISCGRYAEAAYEVPKVFGLSPASVSRRFIKATAKKLQAFMTRPLDGYDFIAVVVDGKTFAEDQMVVAVGITLTGEKILLGFVQTATENAIACTAFFQTLIERGLVSTHGLLFVIDGSKGLHKAIEGVFAGYALIQRCQWHKRENVVAYLPKGKQTAMRRQLQHAYEKPTYEEAVAALQACRQELVKINKSAVASLEEGLEETLTLHRLGVFAELGKSLKTTNCLESINAQITRTVRRITHWKNSDQKQRWLAAALVALEPRLRRIKGHKALPLLRHALQRALKIQSRQVA